MRREKEERGSRREGMRGWGYRKDKKEVRNIDL